MDGNFNYSKSVFVITKSNGCFDYYSDLNRGSFNLAKLTILDYRLYLPRLVWLF